MCTANQVFRVENCSHFCTGAQTISGVASATCTDMGSFANCECIRPFFPVFSNETARTGGECISALHLTGLAPVVPIQAIQTIFQLYNIVYASWIVILKGVRTHNSKYCCTCNFVVAGASCVIGMELARLLFITDPYNYFEEVPDRIAYILNQIANTLVIGVAAFVFLSFNAAVQSQSLSDQARQRNWPKTVVIILTIIGGGASATRDVVVIILRSVGFGSYEALTYSIFSGVVSLALLIMFILMTIEARILHLRLINFAKTFTNRRSHARVIVRIDELVKVLKRYFYVGMGCSFITLFLLVAYTVCLGDLSAWSHVFSWAAFNTMQGVTTLLFLFILEGKSVSAFPCRGFSCCKTKAAEKQAVYKEPGTTAYSSVASPTPTPRPEYITPGAELRSAAEADSNTKTPDSPMTPDSPLIDKPET